MRPSQAPSSTQRDRSFTPDIDTRDGRSSCQPVSHVPSPLPPCPRRSTRRAAAIRLSRRQGSLPSRTPLPTVAGRVCVRLQGLLFIPDVLARFQHPARSPDAPPAASPSVHSSSQTRRATLPRVCAGVRAALPSLRQSLASSAVWKPPRTEQTQAAAKTSAPMDDVCPAARCNRIEAGFVQYPCHRPASAPPSQAFNQALGSGCLVLGARPSRNALLSRNLHGSCQVETNTAADRVE